MPDCIFYSWARIPKCLFDVQAHVPFKIANLWSKQNETLELIKNNKKKQKQANEKKKVIVVHYLWETIEDS